MGRPFKADENKPIKAGTPEKPAHLSKQASIEWDRLAGELAEAGILVTKAHRAAMTIAATTAADIADDWKVLEAEGRYVTNPKTGAVQAHPAGKSLAALRRDYIKALALLGLKSAVAGEQPEGDEDEHDRALREMIGQ